MTTSTCSPGMIVAFLDDRLDETQQAEFERHLDGCDRCCAELRNQTADERLWIDARNCLSSVENVAESGRSQVGQAAFDLKRLDFLAPTDDPSMLGRFGGYEISGVIGCGGMGVVLKGFDRALSRCVAIKVLGPHYASSGAARDRFAREAQAAAAVVHDHVVAIHGVDEFNGLPYLVMPYIKGESLQKRIDRAGTLSPTEVLRIGMQVARGLAAAHDQGLVHRDIKPGNLLLPENVERVMITDFGLARAADDASLTRSGVIAGTPQFMSPEQASGDRIDTRSDLFSLGSVLYAMCTGHPPFRAETPYGILRRITDSVPRPIREMNPDIPPWLCRVVDRLLAKEPAARFQTADEVANLLSECLAHVQQPLKTPLPPSLRSREAFRRGSRKVLFVALGCLALIGAWMGGPDTENAKPAADQSGNPMVLSEAMDSLHEEAQVPLPSMAELEWSMDDDISRLQQRVQQLKSELRNVDRAPHESGVEAN